MGHPLRSGPVTGPSTLLWDAPPLCPASVLWYLRLYPLARLPLHRGDRFSRSPQMPAVSSRHALRRMPLGPEVGNARTDNRINTNPAFDIVLGSRRLITWFTCVRLLTAYLTQSCHAFSMTAHHNGS